MLPADRFSAVDFWAALPFPFLAAALAMVIGKP
jgi:hypothetical protein